MYLVSKSDNRTQYRIYLENSEIEGRIVYKGHKLGVDSNLLSEILDYRFEKSSNKIHFLKYDKVDGEPDYRNSDIWIIGRNESIQKNLLDSWISLNQSMREKFGDYRKIIITKVNI
jgi:hypothetical protein